MQQFSKLVIGLALIGSLLGAYQNPTSAAPAALQDDSGAKRCTVTGRVTDAQSGEPLRKATVRLARRGGNGNGFASQGYAGTSESDGSFRFEGIDPGAYNLSGERSGYLMTQYGARSFTQAGTTLNLSAGQEMSGLTLSLIPQGTIAGRVVDSDGDPVGGARVQAIRRTWVRGGMRNMPFSSASTDDSGEFRLARMQQGKYYLMAGKQDMRPGNYLPAIPTQKDVRAVPTYYPDAVTMDTAAPVDVKAGQSLTGLDIRIRTSETYHVRGKISGIAVTGSAQLMVSINSQDDVMGNPFGHPANLGKDRSFDFAGIAPGKYVVTASEMSGNIRSLGRQEVQVGSGDVSDVALDLVSPGSLRGQVRMEGVPSGNAGGSLTQVRVSLMAIEAQPMGTSGSFSMVKEDGTFSFENVSAGRFALSTNNLPSGAYLASVRLGQQELVGKEIDLSQGATGELQVVFRYGAAEVSGTMQADSSAAGDTAANGVGAANGTGAKTGATTMAVLIPEALSADGSGTRMANPDQNGSFSIKQVPPGRYHAVAIEQPDYNELQNPELLKQLAGRGTEIELKENDKKQIQLSPLSASQMRDVLAQAGLDPQ